MKLFLYFLLALLLVILDTSLFSFLPIYGATIITSYAGVILFALFFDVKSFFYFSLSTVFFFSVFSSLPVLLIILLFFILPALLYYFKTRYLPEPTLIGTIFYLIFANLMFELILIAYFGEWNRQGLLVLAYFTFINSIIALLPVFFLSRKRGSLIKVKI